jgi:hypothetical protein
MGHGFSHAYGFSVPYTGRMSKFELGVAVKFLALPSVAFPRGRSCALQLLVSRTEGSFETSIILSVVLFDLHFENVFTSDAVATGGPI